MSKDERLRNAQLILSSSYTRAMQTAAILSKELNLEIQVAQLKELGTDFDLNNGVYPVGDTRLWESKPMMKARIDGVINKYLNYDYVIIAGHGMAFRTQYKIDDIPHAHIIEYRK